MIDVINSKLGGCKGSASICLIQSPYEEICDPVFFIMDPEGEYPSKVCNSEEAHVSIVNRSGQCVWFIKLDSCLIPRAQSKCDCLVISKQRAVFLELKTSCNGSRSNRRKEAAEQLLNTLKLFEDNDLLDKTKEIKAIIAFKRNYLYPIQASRNTMRALFLEKFSADLVEGNEIEL